MSQMKITLKAYLTVFVTLLVFTVLTTGVAFIDLGGPLNTVAAVTIACVKALLVILYFMHVRYSSKLTWVFAGTGFAWLLILLMLTFNDYSTRGW